VTLRIENGKSNKKPKIGEKKGSNERRVIVAIVLLRRWPVIEFRECLSSVVVSDSCRLVFRRAQTCFGDLEKLSLASELSPESR
jgi:hypothetical protein